VFGEPTVNDFLARIDWHISKSLDRAGRAVARVRADAAKNGAFQSGRRVILSIDAVRAEFEAGIEATLGEPPFQAQRAHAKLTFPAPIGHGIPARKSVPDD
jgi:hypothetical protein